MKLSIASKIESTFLLDDLPLAPRTTVIFGMQNVEYFVTFNQIYHFQIDIDIDNILVIQKEISLDNYPY